MRKTYIVSGEYFKTKGELQERVKGILWTYLEGQSLPDNDFEFMLDLLSNHPRADIKIGCGVARIFTKKNPIYTHTRAFYLERTDGSQTDFSYIECITPASKRKKFFRACRALLEPSMMTFKQRFFDERGGVATCEFTGQPIQFIGSHVDHVPPKTFDTLLNEFIELYQIDPETITLKDELLDNKYQDELADEALAELWVNWHNERASLRVVSRLANLSHVKAEANRRF
jgi:hypothetical protein